MTDYYPGKHLEDADLLFKIKSLATEWGFGNVYDALQDEKCYVKSSGRLNKSALFRLMQVKPNVGEKTLRTLQEGMREWFDEQNERKDY